jgi:hypothetical protein
MMLVALASPWRTIKLRFWQNKNCCKFIRHWGWNLNFTATKYVVLTFQHYLVLKKNCHFISFRRQIKIFVYHRYLSNYNKKLIFNNIDQACARTCCKFLRWFNTEMQKLMFSKLKTETGRSLKMRTQQAYNEAYALEPIEVERNDCFISFCDALKNKQVKQTFRTNVEQAG